MKPVIDALMDFTPADFLEHNITARLCTSPATVLNALDGSAILERQGKPPQILNAGEAIHALVRHNIPVRRRTRFRWQA